LHFFVKRRLCRSVRALSTAAGAPSFGSSERVYNPPVPKGEYLQYGGQAIIEGVMMRSPRFFSVACRAPNGEIVLQTEALEKTWIGRQKWLKLPFLRGTLGILDAMVLGIKAMKFASDVQLDPKYQPPEEEPPHDPLAEAVHTATGAEDPAKKPPAGFNRKIQDAAVIGALLGGIALGLLLFNFLPNLIAEQSRHAGVTSGTAINFTTEIIKVVFFLAYLWLIGRMPEIRKVFQYHGAEHKAINTLEADQELTLGNCAGQTRLHPRCGTSFAIVVLIVSMVLFTFVPRYPLGQDNLMIVNVFVRFVLELMILPLIAGLAYELIRLAGKMRRNELVMMLFMPGLWTQYLTTAEPDEPKIEVALTALRAVVDAEEHASRPAEDAVHEAAAVVS